MAKVLVVVRTLNGTPPHHICQVLHHLGIESTVAFCDGTSSTAFRAGSLVSAPTSDSVRGYLRQFDGVLVLESTQGGATGTDVASSYGWLSWNEPEDPPVAYMGIGLQTVRTGINALIPADFPIIRPNPSDLANTAVQADLTGTITTIPVVGTPVFLTRESETVYVPTFDFHTSDNTPYFWRLDLAKHSALGSDGEILAVPRYPDRTFEDDAVAGYRYKNRYLLPRLILSALYQQPNTVQNRYLFWVLYALKCMGIAPAWRIPIHFETDHPLEMIPPANRVDGLSFANQARVLRGLYDWLVQFCEPRGLVMIHGVNVGGRDRTAGTRQHWVAVNRPDIVGDEANAIARQAHEIFVANHRKTQACGPHDHTLPGYGLGQVRGRVASVARHTGGQYGAPNNIPIAHGILVNRRYAPAEFTGLEYALDAVEWVEQVQETSGTGTTLVNAEDNCYHFAKMIVEGHMDEMRALGFPDGHAGEQRYTNTAMNSSGGLPYWQAYREAGFRGMRSSYINNGLALVSPNRLWQGFHLLECTTLDDADDPNGGYGLYYPGAPSEAQAITQHNLDYGDILSLWESDRETAGWRAYRRLMCRQMGRWLELSVGALGACYYHPNYLYGANPNAPTERFHPVFENGRGQPHFNAMVEYLMQMDALIRVLSPYLKWGSVSELMDLRERVYGL